MVIRFLLQATATALTLLPLVLSGCATTSPDPVIAESIAPEPTIEPPTPDYFENFIDQQLVAVESLIELEHIEEARAIIDGLIYEKINIAQQTRYVLSQAKIALAISDGQQALSWISGEYAHLLDGLPLDDQIEISLMRAEAFELSGRPLSAARERIFLAPVLDHERAEENQEQIWFDLHMVPETEIRSMVANESSPDLNGWLELSLISLNQGYDLNMLLNAVEQWQEDHPRHPANRQLPNSLQMLKELALAQPSHLAVMLPLTGQLEQAGNAIRNGLVSAWYQAKADGMEIPELHFYDTSGREDITELYSYAVNAGAQLIIGPLAKNNVQQLVSHDQLTVPVLTLNYADTRSFKIPNLYQFGLAPEDEATQIANDIWQQGARNVMVVTPDSQWGDRVSDTFISQWQLLGGTISSKARFGRPDQYLSSIKQALNIAESEQRHALLENRLDSDLEFEFRRRQDIDAVFMAAFPAQARQLKPVLNYQRAESIPVVATSHVYYGQSAPDKDKDLNSVRFIDMPWRLHDSEEKQRSTAQFPDSPSSYAHLVALGMDAYRLFPRLPQMSVFSDVRVQGATGGLTMSESGRVIRQLDWAEFKNGQVIPLDPQEHSIDD